MQLFKSGWALHSILTERAHIQQFNSLRGAASYTDDFRTSGDGTHNMQYESNLGLALAMCPPGHFQENSA